MFVVDDEPRIRMDIAYVLERAGRSPVQAASAAEAVSAVDSDLSLKAVISEIQMPGHLDGIGLSHYVAERRLDVRMILSSAHKPPSGSDLPPSVAFLLKPVVAAHPRGGALPMTLLAVVWRPTASEHDARGCG